MSSKSASMASLMSRTSSEVDVMRGDLGNGDGLRGYVPGEMGVGEAKGNDTRAPQRAGLPQGVGVSMGVAVVAAAIGVAVMLRRGGS